MNGKLAHVTMLKMERHAMAAEHPGRSVRAATNHPYIDASWCHTRGGGAVSAASWPRVIAPRTVRHSAA